MKTASRTVIILAMWAAVISASNARADTVTYGGVSLAIDSQEDLNDGTIKVVVRGKPVLLAKDGFERSVALQYLADSELAALIPSGELLTLISGSLQGGDSEVAVNGIATAIRSRTMSPEAFGDFIEKVGALPESRSAIGAALRLVAQDVRDQTLCLCLPHTDIEKLTDFDVQRSRPSFASNCFTSLSGAALALFRKGDIPGVKRVLEALVQLRLSDSQLIKGAQSASLIFAQATDAASSGQHAAVVTALESLRKDPMFGPVAAVGASAVLTKLGEQSLQQGDNSAALYYLTRVDFKQRTPQQHVMLSRVIRGLTASSLKFVFESKTQSVLIMYAGKDEALRGELIEYLERAFKETLGSHDVETSREAIKLISALRPDPSERNDSLRRLVADELIALKRPQEARLALQEVQVVRVPLSLKIWLFASGSVGGLIVVSLSGVVLVTALVLGAVIARRRYLSNQASGRGDSGQGRGSVATAADGSDSGSGDASDEKAHKRSFVFFPPEFRMSGWRGEYESLLSYFGLTNEATLNEIKVAYRRRVKEAHPDLNLTAVGDSSDEFIELSKKYERLLELYEQQEKATSTSEGE